MTPTTQPQPALAWAASPTPPGDPEATRLLRLWVELTQRAASAAAHRSGDDESLRNMHIHVEDALADRLPNFEAIMADLWVWESTLIHTAATPSETCLLCRKARQGPPNGSRLASIGGV